MAKHQPWKDLERRHAKRMRGKRLWRPDFGESMPDGENEREVWDTKCYARFSVIGLFVAAELKYRKYAAGRRFHLGLFDRSRRGAGDFVLLRASDYVALLEKAGEFGPPCGTCGGYDGPYPDCPDPACGQ